MQFIKGGEDDYEGVMQHIADGLFVTDIPTAYFACLILPKLKISHKEPYSRQSYVTLHRKRIIQYEIQRI